MGNRHTNELGGTVFGVVGALGAAGPAAVIVLFAIITLAAIAVVGGIEAWKVRDAWMPAAMFDGSEAGVLQAVRCKDYIEERLLMNACAAYVTKGIPWKDDFAEMGCRQVGIGTVRRRAG